MLIDTSIRLVSSKPQLAFLGEVIDNRLLKMTKVKNALAVVAIKWILGDDFVTREDRYKVNTDTLVHLEQFSDDCSTKLRQLNVIILMYLFVAIFRW